MKTPDGSILTKIAQLRDTRVKAAQQSRVVTERDLAGRELRAQLEEKLRLGQKDPRDEKGLTWLVPPLSAKADYEKFAKVHPLYLQHERESARLAYERDVTNAAAESLRLEIEALLVAMEVAGRDVVTA